MVDQPDAPTPMVPVLSAEQFTKLQEAAKRLIAVQNEVLGMPQEQQQWFFGKEGHTDAFDLAWWVNIKLPQLRALLAQRDKRVEELEHKLEFACAGMNPQDESDLWARYDAAMKEPA